MARPLERDYGAKQTTITLPFTVWEALRRENVNVSDECAKHLTTLIKHPGFKKKQTEKRRLKKIFKYVDPDFLRAMRSRVKKDKNTAHHWKAMIKKRFDMDVGVNDIVKWVFEDWDVEKDEVK